MSGFVRLNIAVPCRRNGLRPLKANVVYRGMHYSSTTKSRSGAERCDPVTQKMYTLTPRIVPLKAAHQSPEQQQRGGPSTRFPPTLVEGMYPSTPAEALTLLIDPAVARPEYTRQPHGVPPPVPEERYGEVKNQNGIRSMRAAGVLAARALQLAMDLTVEGATPNAVEQNVVRFIAASGGYPSPLGFHGFPRALVVSVNEACCHGIPNTRRFQPGDVVKYDCIVYLDGYHGDCAATTVVGSTSLRRQEVVEACRRARDEAIKQCGPGVPLRVIGAVISEIARAHSCGIVDILSGHFIGTEMHMPPLVPHTKNEENYVLKAGNTLTIEPIFTEGSSDIDCWNDGWTIVTRDRGFSAQWEHTILIGDNGAEILTPLRAETPSLHQT